MTDETPQQPAGPARLLRSRRDRVIGGVCGGLAAYLGIDSTLVRIGTVVLAFISGGAVVLGYIIALLLVPEGDDATPQRSGGANGLLHAVTADQGRLILGGVLVAVGLIWVIGLALPGVLQLRIAGPIVLIVLGTLVLIGIGTRR